MSKLITTNGGMPMRKHKQQLSTETPLKAKNLELTEKELGHVVGGKGIFRTTNDKVEAGGERY
jgi:hypothetical protein